MKMMQESLASKYNKFRTLKEYFSFQFHERSVCFDWLHLVLQTPVFEYAESAISND